MKYFLVAVLILAAFLYWRHMQSPEAREARLRTALGKEIRCLTLSCKLRSQKGQSSLWFIYTIMV